VVDDLHVAAVLNPNGVGVTADDAASLVDDRGISRRQQDPFKANHRAAVVDKDIRGDTVRLQDITRKNSLFAGSDGGGSTWATIATLLQTA
jgi:hypothetical protein